MSFNTANLLQPENNNQKLWRYSNIPKLLSALTDNSFSFSLTRIHQDQFEGRLPSSLYQEMVRQNDSMLKLVQQRGLDLGLPDVSKKLGPSDREPKLLERVSRSSTYVNCWCGLDREDSLMWDHFAGEHGCAIVTTYGDLKNNIVSPNGFALFGGMLRYIEDGDSLVLSDVAKDDFDRMFGLSLPQFKRAYFSAEHEFRLILVPDNAFHPIVKDRKEIEKVPCDMNAVIQRIITHPRMEPWIVDSLRAVVIALGYSGDLIQTSEMSIFK